MAFRNKKSLKPISDLVGVGLRSQHYQEILDRLPNIGFLEIHCENYFGKGGRPLHYLEQISQQYPLSFHGVGLSLGSADGLDSQHLKKLKNLVTCFNPVFVSEHLCWTSIGGMHFNDLLPIPYTDEALALIIKHVQQAQDFLKRNILIENISTYMEYNHSVIPEYEFMMEVVSQTGCGILLDVNNLYVNASNHHWDITTYLSKISPGAVEEIHLAGFTKNDFEEGSLLIDTHDKPVAAAVWEVYEQTIQSMGLKPTLIEWDKDLPELEVLLGEADKARKILEHANLIPA